MAEISPSWEIAGKDVWNYPVYVVNMKAHHERREAAIDRLTEAGLSPTLVDAADGRARFEEFRRLADEPGRLKRASKPLTAGELGCYMSHWGIFEMMVAKQIPQALVLEDDFLLTPEFPAILDRLASMSLPDYDVIKLAIGEAGRSKAFTVVAPIIGEHALVRHHNVCNSTVAYIITLSAARKFLRYGMPIRYPIDVALNRSWEHGLNVLGIRPWPVIHDHHHSSTIGGERFEPKRERTPFGLKLERRWRKGLDSLAKRLQLWRWLLQDASWRRRSIR